MHGHWLSTTRKLNRHYQSSGVGATPVDPFTPTFGRFSCAAYVIPHQFKHTGRVSVIDENFYDTSFSYSANLSSTYMDNLVRMVDYEGYKYDKLGGCFQCGGTPSGIAEIDNNGLQYGGKNIGGYSPVTDPGNSAFFYTPLRATGTGLLFKDYGYKYAKVSIPKYNFGPAYYTTKQAAPLPSGTYFTENVYERLAPQPVFNNITLDTDEITRLSNVRGTQVINLTEEYHTKVGASGSRVIQFLYGGSNAWNLTALKTNGVAYIDRVISIYENGISNKSISVTARLYTFLYKNEYYFSTKPELYYNGELLEGYDNIYVSKHFFPSGLGGYPHVLPFESAGLTDFYRWVEYDFGDSPSSDISRYFNMGSNISYLGKKDNGYLYFPHHILPFARIRTVSDTEWARAVAGAWT